MRGQKGDAALFVQRGIERKRAASPFERPIELILEDRREDMLRGLPADAIQATVFVE